MIKVISVLLGWHVINVVVSGDAAYFCSLYEGGSSSGGMISIESTLEC